MNQRSDRLGFQRGVPRTGATAQGYKPARPPACLALDLTPDTAKKQEMEDAPNQCIQCVTYGASGGQKTPLALKES